MDLIRYKLTTLTHSVHPQLQPLCVKRIPSLSKASHHFTVVRVSGGGGGGGEGIVSAKALNYSNVFLGHQSGRT